MSRFNELYEALVGYKISDRYFESLPQDLLDLENGIESLREFGERLHRYFDDKDSLRWAYIDYNNKKRPGVSARDFMSAEDHALIHVWYGLMSPMSQKLLVNGYGLH